MFKGARSKVQCQTKLATWFSSRKTSQEFEPRCVYSTVYLSKDFKCFMSWNFVMKLFLTSSYKSVIGTLCRFSYLHIEIRHTRRRFLITFANILFLRKVYYFARYRNRQFVQLSIIILSDKYYFIWTISFLTLQFF